MLAQADIDRAKETNLLDLIGKDTRLRKVASTAGGEYAGPCPFCGGCDRLRVQPDRGLWWCRQCSGEHWQDAIAYVKRRDRVEFTEAVQQLISGRVGNPFRPAKPRTESDCPASPPTTEWQAKARKIIAQCETVLWSDQGVKARKWLNDRGLNDETLRTWHVGYQEQTCDIAGLRVEHGIVIPCEMAGVVWYIKVRRPVGKPKYMQMKGGRSALFGAETLGAHEYAVLAEGEFDALLAWQILQHATNCEWHTVGVATLGSATIPQGFVSTWARYLLPVSRFLICYDLDRAGETGADTWSTITTRAVRVAVPKIKPADKDLTDFHKSGGRILDLVTHEIARDKWQREQIALTAQSAQKAPAIGRGQDSQDRLRAERDIVLAEWNRLFDELETLRQDTPEFDRLFAEWLKLDEKYKQLDDQVATMEITMHIRQTTK